MKKFILLALTLSISLPAFADDRLAALTSENPGATPYQILKKLFDEAQAGAESDLDSYDIKSRELTRINAGCAIVKSSSQAQPRNISLFRYVSKKITHAVPASGPLFPGTPERIEDRVGYLFSSSELDPNFLNWMKIESTWLPITTTMQTNAEFIISINDKDGDVFIGGYTLATVAVRKNGNYVVFKQTASDTSENTKIKDAVAYGYCWK